MKGELSRRDFIRITAISAGLLAVGGVALKELFAEPELKTYDETRLLLGTFATIKVVDTDEDKARQMVQDSFAEMGRLSGILSRFNPNSELYHLNRTGQIISASNELVVVVERALHYSELTSGAFDVTVLPLLELNQESFDKYNSPPDDSEIAEVKRLVDYRAINIKGRDITLTRTGAGITLDSIAKGYIVDLTADQLREQGNTDRVIVEAGGDMYLSGMRQDDQPWRIGIAHPRAIGGLYEVISSSNGAIATSGDYESNFTSDYRYHHIIDPKAGISPAEIASATVLAKSTLCADALATACIVMGKDRALALIESLPDVEALLIDKGLKGHSTSGFPCV